MVEQAALQRIIALLDSDESLTATVLQSMLEAIVMEAVLDQHYQSDPQSRPDLGDLAIAAAQIDGHPLAVHPEQLRQAATEITAGHPTATPDDVLLWAEARAMSAA